MASQRIDVASVAFPWERAIPFVPWTIVPYWSIDLLYVLALLACTTRRELDRHALRLLLVQVVCVAAFLVVPLRFSFPRPAVGGGFGALFTLLRAFDAPFNQAPSLHIGLLVVIWARLLHHVPSWLRWPLHGWMALIGVSVLTTWQHHFVDVPTGLGVGLAALWALPVEGPAPLVGIALTADPARRRVATTHGLLSLACAAAAIGGGTRLWLAWPALAFALVAFCYAAVGAPGFQKRPDGRLTAGAVGLLAPYLGVAWLNSRLWTRRAPEPVAIADGVFIGRIPTRAMLARAPFALVVDLCAELPCGRDPRVRYTALPVLDLTAPDHETLRAAVAAIEDGRRFGPVLVCCALGYSRSACAVAAWLLATGRAPSATEALHTVRRSCPATVLDHAHRSAIEVLA